MSQICGQTLVSERGTCATISQLLSTNSHHPMCATILSVSQMPTSATIPDAWLVFLGLSAESTLKNS